MEDGKATIALTIKILIGFLLLSFILEISNDINGKKGHSKEPARKVLIKK